MATEADADAFPQVRYWIPEGYVTEEGLRADVDALARRGFGALELVALNFFDADIPDGYCWGSNHYYEAVRVVLREAAARGMAVDLANGPGWPISVPQIADADDPATLYELTYGTRLVTDTQPLALPARRVVHDEGTPVLIAVCAYRAVPLHEGLLDADSYVDLLPYVQDDRIDWQPEPDGTDGTWRVFAFWAQPACQKVLDKHYVIDHLSCAGAEANIAWWEDELLPALGDEARHLRSFFCDSLEYRVAMEWTRDFPAVFAQRHGYSILPYLPVVGEPATYPKNDVPSYRFTRTGLTEAVQRDYRETLSWMFRERHLRTLCDAAARLGKTVRYQVAYNKPFCEEDAAALVDLPENESLGRPSLDNLRVMAGAAHLARKLRYSFEAAAEFGHGYGQTQRDLLWWLKRAAIAGCNTQVLHGASYCGAGMHDVAWPGWDAWNRICSNNWNRTLSEPSFAQMNRAIARLNALRRARALVDVAFVREAYLNDGHGADGAHVVRDDGLLCAHGYSYEFLSPALLAHEHAQVAGGHLDPDGAAYQALVLAEQDVVQTETLLRLAALAQAGLPVFVMGGTWLSPQLMAPEDRRAAWQAAHDALLACENVTVAPDYPVLLAAFEAAGIAPAARYEAAHVFSAHVMREGKDYYLLYNGNAVRTGADGKADLTTIMPGALASGVLEPVAVEVALAGTGQPCRYDLVSGRRSALPYTQAEGRVVVPLSLEADELVVIELCTDGATLPLWAPEDLVAHPLDSWSLTLHELQESADPRDFLAGGYRKRARLEALGALRWWDELADVPADFAGYGSYHAVVVLDEVPEQALLRLPAWNDALELEVNGRLLPVVAGLGSLIDVREALQPGDNELDIRVYSNLSNRLDGLNEKHGPLPRQHYGLCGPVSLLLSE